jgi:hypothetical protein
VVRSGECACPYTTCGAPCLEESPAPLSVGRAQPRRRSVIHGRWAGIVSPMDTLRGRSKLVTDVLHMACTFCKCCRSFRYIEPIKEIPAPMMLDVLKFLLLWQDGANCLTRLDPNLRDKVMITCPRRVRQPASPKRANEVFAQPVYVSTALHPRLLASSVDVWCLVSCA